MGVILCPNTQQSGGEQPNFVFTSDWAGVTDGSFALTDVRDTGKSVPWQTHVGNTVDDLGVDSVSLSVRATTGLGFPAGMTRCLRVDAVHGSEIGEDTTLQQYASGMLSFGATNTAWSVPGIGDSLYFRIYKRFVWPDGATNPNVNLGSANHCVEETTQVARTWHWTFNSSAAGWQPSFNANSPVTRHIIGGSSNLFIPRDQTHRIEWRVHRTGENTCEFETRVYDTNDSALLYQTSDFATAGDVELEDASFGYETGSAVYFQLGTNGLGFGSQPENSVRPAWYFGGVAVSDEGWPGPHVVGESV